MGIFNLIQYTKTQHKILEYYINTKTQIQAHSLHTLFWKGLLFLWCVRDEWKTYTQREDFFFPSLLPGARVCQRLHLLASRDTSDRLRVPRSTVSLPLSKSDLVVLITWFPFCYTPVVPECSDVLSSQFTHHSVTACQSTHCVTRNEPLYNISSVIRSLI